MGPLWVGTDRRAVRPVLRGRSCEAQRFRRNRPTLTRAPLSNRGVIRISSGQEIREAMLRVILKRELGSNGPTTHPVAEFKAHAYAGDGEAQKLTRVLKPDGSTDLMNEP